MRRHLHAGRGTDVVGPVEVDEAPRPDHPPGLVGQRPGDRHGAWATQRDGGAGQHLPYGLDGHRRATAAGRLPGFTFQVAHAPTPSAPSRMADARALRPPWCSITAVVVPMDLLISSIPEWKVRWRRSADRVARAASRRH